MLLKKEKIPPANDSKNWITWNIKVFYFYITALEKLWASEDSNHFL